MANGSVFLSDLQTGRSAATVHVRLLRFWEARNVRRDGELMGVDMLLLDSQSTMMPATINVNRLAAHRPNLKAGSVYSLTGFDVTRCNQNYRLSNSVLLIRFSETTSFTVVDEPAVLIPLESFRFRNHSEMLGLANSNTQLPDIIGEITAVTSTVSDPPQEKNRVMATIKMDNDNTVTMSFFDTQALQFHNKIDTMRGDPRVIVATSVNPKMVGSRLFLNATSGTHVYFDKETAAGEAHFYGLVSQETGLTPAAPLLKGYAKVESLTIAELNSFVLTAPTQEIDFICTGKVTGINIEKGWCYVSCSSCVKKLQRTISSFTCVSCNNTNAVGVLRYRVELSAADESGEAMFVCFDGVMTKLHNLKASEAGHLLADAGVNPEDTAAPPFVTDMVGRTYTFQVRVNHYNFTANHQTFTVSRIISEHDRAPRPAFVTNGGDDDNGDGGSGSASVKNKTDDAGCSKPQLASAKMKKARKA